MNIVLIDKIYTEENIEDIDYDMDKIFRNDKIKFDVDGLVKGGIRILFEYIPEEL